MDPAYLTAAEVAAAVRSGKITARELTGLYLARCNAANETLNTLIHVFADTALDQAEAVDEKIKQGRELPLAGVPVAVKDNFYYRGGPVTCGSAALHDFRPPGDATAIQKLTEAGAVIIGKTNLDRFDLGSSTVHSCAGASANPWDQARVAGDGAAAAVAAGQALLALSSDTGGTLRAGASHCGQYGLLPTTGLVSRYGLCSAAPSFTRAGIVARNAADTLLALQVIAGPDPRDPATTTAGANCLDHSEEQKDFLPDELKAGFPAAVFAMLDEPLRSLLEQFRNTLTALGVRLVDISLPLFRKALQAYYVMAMAESSSNLSRFDGIRFGATSEKQELEQRYRETRAATLGEEGIRHSIFGTVLLNRENYTRFYLRARQVGALVKHEFLTALEQCNLVLLPAMPAPAGRIETVEARSFLQAYQENMFCAPVSLAGLPALSVPAGWVGALPLGMQLVGHPFQEALLAGLAGQITFPPGEPVREGRWLWHTKS